MGAERTRDRVPGSLNFDIPFCITFLKRLVRQIEIKNRLVERLENISSQNIRQRGI